VLATETLVGDRYRLGEIIGRGGGADVFRADDLTTGGSVAVKVLRAATPTDLRRFESAADTLRRLDHHAIVRMHDDGEHDGVPYLVLDLVDGDSLATKLHRGPMPEDEVRALAARLAGALAYAHSLGVVHRDVKPGNVLFDEHDDAHLTDFGIARLTDATAITSTGFVIGTAAYLAPEQVTGSGAVPASDVYALGLVILEALTGEREYPGSPSESAIARLQRAPEIPATVSPALARQLAAMTDAEPDKRPSAAAVAQAFGDDSVPRDATAVMPVASDATVAIPIATAAAIETNEVATSEPARSVPARSVPAASTGRAIDRRALVGVLVVGAIVLLLLLGNAFGGSGGPTAPATADTTTTVVAVTNAPTTVATTTTTVKRGPDKHGKGGQNGNGD